MIMIIVTGYICLYTLNISYNNISPNDDDGDDGDDDDDDDDDDNCNDGDDGTISSTDIRISDNGIQITSNRYKGPTRG